MPELSFSFTGKVLNEQIFLAGRPKALEMNLILTDPCIHYVY